MTTILISAETVVLGLVSLLVVGLLRSHAEILRRLGAMEQPGGRARRHSEADDFEDMDPRIPKPGDAELGHEAPEIVGTTIEGDQRKVAFPASRDGTLVAFLSSGCEVCGEFWRAFAEGGGGLPDGTRLVIVTKDTTHESPSKLIKLRPKDIPVLMSSQAWQSYEVPVAPYFAYVDGPSGRIVGEGSAANWDQLRSLFTDYLFDRDFAARNEDKRRRDTAGGHDARVSRVDAELTSGGVGPGHHSLYDSAELPEERNRPILGVVQVDGASADGRE